MANEDWLSSLSPEEQKQWDDFVAHTRTQTIKAMDDSAFVMNLVPDRDHLDVKFAVELGLSVMMDKAILAVVTPGVKVPEKLRQVADVVVEIDIDTEDGQKKLAEAIVELREKIKSSS